MTLDDAIQLHEVLEIHYYVDHYEAQLMTKDGDRMVLCGMGPTVDTALDDLRLKLRTVPSIAELRALPTVDSPASAPLVNWE